MDAKTRVFVDMDGTLLYLKEWTGVQNVEPGYFCDGPYFANLVGALKMLHDSGRFEIFILSAYYKSCSWALDEKNKFINSRCPWIDLTHRILQKLGTQRQPMCRMVFEQQTC